MKKRIVVTVFVCMAFVSMLRLAHLVIFPARAMDVGVRQIEDDAMPFYEVQTFSIGRGIFMSTVVCVFLALLALMWRKPIKHLIEGANREDNQTNHGDDGSRPADS